MAHKQQQEFCLGVKSIFPKMFKEVRVLDCGSLDLNGNNRYLFNNCIYIGIDIGEGNNVDVVCKASEYKSEQLFDTVISTEMLEHDSQYKESLLNMFSLLKPGGLLLITAAGTGRAEHGTTRSDSASSPFTNDYYLNITNEMFQEVLPRDLFVDYFIRQYQTDFQFYGIKK